MERLEYYVKRRRKNWLSRKLSKIEVDELIRSQTHTILDNLLELNAEVAWKKVENASSMMASVRHGPFEIKIFFMSTPYGYEDFYQLRFDKKGLTFCRQDFFSDDIVLQPGSRIDKVQRLVSVVHQYGRSSYLG